MIAQSFHTAPVSLTRSRQDCSRPRKTTHIPSQPEAPLVERPEPASGPSGSGKTHPLLTAGDPIFREDTWEGEDAMRGLSNQPCGYSEALAHKTRVDVSPWRAEWWLPSFRCSLSLGIYYPAAPEKGPDWGCCKHQGCCRALQASLGGSPSCPHHALSPPLKWGKWGRLPSGQRALGTALCRQNCGDTSFGKEPGVQLYVRVRVTVLEIKQCVDVPKSVLLGK